MSVYRVAGKHGYREHKPGTTFEASLYPDVEHRALARGDIEVIEISEPALIEGSYRLPEGWPSHKETR